MVDAAQVEQRYAQQFLEFGTRCEAALGCQIQVSSAVC